MPLLIIAVLPLSLGKGASPLQFIPQNFAKLHQQLPGTHLVERGTVKAKRFAREWNISVSARAKHLELLVLTLKSLLAVPSPKLINLPKLQPG